MREQSAATVVAALYVERGGVYWNLPGVDPWDIGRDARQYAGPHPIVAHPPCNRWSLMALCRGRRDGDDEGCFAAALAAVEKYGGVIEHPAHSLAWERFGLPEPPERGWTRNLERPGWSCRVDQRNYGHECRKPTWLYLVGRDDPPVMKWGDAKDRGEISSRGGRKGHGPHKSTHNHYHARSRTPELFRDTLISMARRTVGT